MNQLKMKMIIWKSCIIESGFLRHTMSESFRDSACTCFLVLYQNETWTKYSSQLAMIMKTIWMTVKLNVDSNTFGWQITDEHFSVCYLFWEPRCFLPMSCFSSSRVKYIHNHIFHLPHIQAMSVCISDDLGDVWIDNKRKWHTIR